MLYISIYMLYIAYMYMQRVHVFFRIYVIRSNKIKCTLYLLLFIIYNNKNKIQLL